LYEISITCHQEGDQVRALDEKFVQKLCANQREYSDECYQPAAVRLINAPKDKFKSFTEEWIQLYEVIGGQHMLAASRILALEDEAFKTRCCIVYTGLNKEAKMVAGALHNSTGENWHTTSLKQGAALYTQA
jgi:hypothetical protein